MVIACLSLPGMEHAWAIDIPALTVMSSEMAAAHPELVKQRDALLKERKALLDRTNDHNNVCAKVKAGSEAAARCTKAYSALSTAINSHVQASKQYNVNYRDAAHLAASQTSAPVDSRHEPAGLGGSSDFKGAFTKPSETNPASRVPSNDPNVVDTGHVPSGLPKALDNAIATAYPDAPPAVSDRVRKGFQAVMDNDWKVAKAWFEDALNRDPKNPGLQRLLGLADYTQRHIEPQTHNSGKPFTNEDIPPDADPQTYAMTSTTIHSQEAWMKFLFPDGKHLRKARPTTAVPPELQLPEASDIEFLFGPDAQLPSSKSGKTK